MPSPSPPAPQSSRPDIGASPTGAAVPGALPRLRPQSLRNELSSPGPGSGRFSEPLTGVGPADPYKGPSEGTGEATHLLKATQRCGPRGVPAAALCPCPRLPEEGLSALPRDATTQRPGGATSSCLRSFLRHTSEHPEVFQCLQVSKGSSLRQLKYPGEIVKGFLKKVTTTQISNTGNEAINKLLNCFYGT